MNVEELFLLGPGPFFCYSAGLLTFHLIISLTGPEAYLATSSFTTREPSSPLLAVAVFQRGRQTFLLSPLVGLSASALATAVPFVSHVKQSGLR